MSGLANPTNPTFSVYRRPLPSTNLGFLSSVAIMWDDRESSLASQVTDALTLNLALWKIGEHGAAC